MHMQIKQLTIYSLAETTTTSTPSCSVINTLCHTINDIRQAHKPSLHVEYIPNNNKRRVSISDDSNVIYNSNLSSFDIKYY